MYSRTRTNQGGSILTFVIIGAVLAAAVVGTVFLVRQQGERAQSETPVFEAPAPAPGQPGPDSDNGANGNGTDGGNGSGATPNDNTTRDDATSTPSLPGASDGASDAADDQSPDSATLPQTGPADTIVSLLAVAALTLTVTAYLRSRSVQAL